MAENHAFQYVFQIRTGAGAVELADLDERTDHRPAPGSAIGIGEQDAPNKIIIHVDIALLLTIITQSIR